MLSKARLVWVLQQLPKAPCLWNAWSNVCSTLHKEQINCKCIIVTHQIEQFVLPTTSWDIENNIWGTLCSAAGFRIYDSLLRGSSDQCEITNECRTEGKNSPDYSQVQWEAAKNGDQSHRDEELQ